MSMSYTKLFSTITDSSIWMESAETRLVWITMLAMSDRDGCVFASVNGLAHRARVPEQATRDAIACFLAPDPNSRTPDHEGRRIEVTEGGWRLLNHAFYREKGSIEERRAYMADLMRRKRAQEKKAVSIPLANVTQAEAPSPPEASPNSGKELGESEIVEAWNTSGFSKCLSLSSSRKSVLKARMRDPFWVANWRTALERIKVSAFCQGQNDRGWRADFDFFCRPDSVAKAMEGKYDEKGASKKPRVGGGTDFSAKTRCAGNSSGFGGFGATRGSPGPGGGGEC